MHLTDRCISWYYHEMIERPEWVAPTEQVSPARYDLLGDELFRGTPIVNVPVLKLRADEWLRANYPADVVLGWTSSPGIPPQVRVAAGMVVDKLWGRYVDFYENVDRLFQEHDKTRAAIASDNRYDTKYNRMSRYLVNTIYADFTSDSFKFDASKLTPDVIEALMKEIQS